MAHTHHRCQCKHESLKFCASCQVAYCAQCGKEWVEQRQQYWYTPYYQITSTGTDISSPMITYYDNATNTTTCSHNE